MNSGELPVGTVTFLFTDIEGSTQLLKRLGGDRYGAALADHQRILRDLFAEHGGHEIDTQGDSFFVAFRRARDAVSTAIAAQRRLAEHEWPEGAALRVRMGIHTGEPAVGGERYVGMGVHRAARICSAGHGGQVLVSQTTRELLRDDPIPDASLRDLGEHQLKDMDEPERIFQLAAPGLAQDFPALKTAAPAPFEGREDELAEAAAEELARPWRRPSRRTLLAATFAAAFVGVLLGVMLNRDGATADAAVAPNAVGVIDSDSGRLVSEIPVGATPGEVAVGAGAIWVANTSDDTVSRIDPSSNQVTQTVGVGEGPAGIAVGAGAVWVANGLDGTVSRVDPTINREVLEIRVGNGPSGVAFGEGAVWVTNSADGTVSRIEPATSRVTKTFPAIVGASGVAVGFGRVWIASPTSARVVSLDPRSGRVLTPIGVGVEPSAIAVGAGAVWVANRADGTITRIDPETSSVADTIRVGRSPEGIAAGAKAVWVANSGDATLVRIDPSDGAIDATVPVVNPPRGVALAPEGVYLAVQSTGLEHRGGTLRVLASSAASSVDPAVAAFEAASVLILTNNGLVGFRRIAGVEGARLVPDLATSLPSPTDGGTTYTFQVRRDIRYSNGELVQPEDFKRAIERLFTVGAQSGGSGYYTGIVGADLCRAARCNLDRGIVTDRAARTVTFRLTGPDADFLAKLALPFAVAVPATTPDRDVGVRGAPATGPYRIASFSKDRERIRLVRNTGFREWSSDAQPDGYPDEIVWSWQSGLDSSKRLRSVERGTTDVIVAIGAEFEKAQLDDLAVRAPSRLRISAALATNSFFLNTRVSPFDDVRVRRAVNIALDRESFGATLDRTSVPTCQILPPNLPGYEPTCPYAAGGASRLDVARRLVRNSGTLGEAVTVSVPAPAARHGRYLVSLLASLGYRARLSKADPNEHFARILDSREQVQAGFWGWLPSYPSAADFIPPQLGCAAFVPAAPDRNTNPSQFCDPAIDALMARASEAQALGSATSTTLWLKVERALLAQAPMVPLYNSAAVDILSTRVSNYQYNPQWGVLLGQLWVK